MQECYIPISLFNDFRVDRIAARFGTKGFGAVVKLMLHLAAQPDCRAEIVSGIERELAAFCGVSSGLMSDIIAYGEKLGLFRLKNTDAGFCLACEIFENPTSKKDETEQPFLKVTQKSEKESKIGQNLISEGCAVASPAAEKKEKKKQKKKEDINNINLLNKLPYGESKVVYLTEKEYDKLVARFGETGTRYWIERLENYAGVFPAKFKKYASHYHVILTWASDGAKKSAPVNDTGSKNGYGNIRRLDA